MATIWLVFAATALVLAFAGLVATRVKGIRTVIFHKVIVRVVASGTRACPLAVAS